MIRRIHLSILSLFLVTTMGTIESSLVFGQLSPSPNPVVSEPGTVLGSDAPEGRVNCWISRSTTGAIAVSVFQDGSTLSAKIRQYSKEEEEYSSKKTKITKPNGTNPPTLIAELSIVPVRLEPHATKDGVYEMFYDSPSPAESISVGYLRYYKGTAERSSSDTLVRLNANAQGVDPCNEPPIDDLGEEEEMPVGISTKSPGPSLPFVPAPKP